MLNFIGIGAQKAGTSWLYAMLKRHPDIHFPAGKEVHFWDQYYSRGINWYTDLFRGTLQGIAGEITPAYAILPWVRIKEMSMHFPGIKILFSIRNPVERAWSQVLMHLNRTGQSKNIDTMPDEWFFRFFSSEGSLQRGDYETCLRSWLSCYDPSHFLIFRFEEIRQSPRTLLMNCCRHLGVDSHFYSALNDSILHQKIFRGETHPLRPSLQKFLKKLYQKKIEKLQGFLDMDLSDWLQEKVST